MTNSLPTASTARYTSWGQDDDMQWNGFRQAVIAGADADTAADLAGLDRIPAAPKVEFEW